MRALYSLVALLLVVWVVMKLSATQLQALAPAAGGSSTSGAGNGAPSAAQQTADQVQRAIEQGAAQRALEAASAGGR